MKNFIEIFNDKTIYPFDSRYSQITMLDHKQLRSYKYILSELLKGHKVDIADNLSYLFVILHETTRDIIKTKDFKYAIDVITKLKILYSEFDILNTYCLSTIADLNLCMGNYNEYLNIMRANFVTGISTSTHQANEVINIKYKYNIPINAEELLCITNKLTKFGKENINDVINAMNVILQEQYLNCNNDFVDKIAKYELLRCDNYALSLFCGNPYNSELNRNLVEPELKKHYICFYANKKFLDIIKDLSRRCENMVRDAKGLPKVNEGWISEAKLYYAIKQEFSHYTVIHQYRCKCLGLQSLDIFIKELNIGIEYQGAQHIRPVEYFGGKEAFKKIQERDKKKKRLCNRNGIKLIYVYENYVLEDVFNEIKMCILD